jgi:hypothetical protein
MHAGAFYLTKPLQKTCCQIAMQASAGSLELLFKSLGLLAFAHSLPYIPYIYKNVDQLTFKINYPQLPAFSQKPLWHYVLARVI